MLSEHYFYFLSVFYTKCLPYEMLRAYRQTQPVLVKSEFINNILDNFVWKYAR